MEAICIVALNWNRKNDLLRLLRSIFRDIEESPTDAKLELVVVDNGSTDGSLDMLETEFPALLTLRNSENLGGSGGFNTGIRYALRNGFDYIWLLDNDAEVLPGALKGLLGAVRTDPRIAIVGSKILHRDDQRVISELGANISRLTTRTKPIKLNALDDEAIANMVDVDYVAVCSALVRSSAIKVFGLLDEAFFVMWDDMEWGIRANSAGFRVVATSNSAVVHPGFSERTITPLYLYYAWRNHLYFAASSFFGLRRIWYLCYLSGLLEAKTCWEALAPERSNHVEALRLAKRDFWQGTFGKASRQLVNISSVNPPDAEKCFQYPSTKKLILSGGRPAPVLLTVLTKVKESVKPNQLLLLIPESRKILLIEMGIREFVSLTKLQEWLQLAFDLRFGGHGLIAFPGEERRPLFSLARQLVVVDENGSVVHTKRGGLRIFATRLSLGVLGFAMFFLRGFGSGVKRSVFGKSFRAIDVSALRRYQIDL